MLSDFRRLRWFRWFFKVINETKIIRECFTRKYRFSLSVFNSLLLPIIIFDLYYQFLSENGFRVKPKPFYFSVYIKKRMKLPVAAGIESYFPFCLVIKVWIWDRENHPKPAVMGAVLDQSEFTINIYMQKIRISFLWPGRLSLTKAPPMLIVLLSVWCTNMRDWFIQGLNTNGTWRSNKS